MPVDIDGLSFEELLELNQRVVARLKMLESMQAHIEMMRFDLGQRVSFEHGGGRLTGALVKYNRKTVTVVTDNGQRWNIPPHLLLMVKDASANQPQQPTGKNKKQLR